MWLRNQFSCRDGGNNNKNVFIEKSVTSSLLILPVGIKEEKVFTRQGGNRTGPKNLGGVKIKVMWVM